MGGGGVKVAETLFNIILKRMNHWVYLLEPRGNGVMDSAFACCAGGPGSIPAVGICKSCYIQMVFSPSRHKVVG